MSICAGVEYLSRPKSLFETASADVLPFAANGNSCSKPFSIVHLSPTSTPISATTIS